MSRAVKDANGNWHLSAGVPQIDGELDATSENPVQNKAVVEGMVEGMSPIVNVFGAKNLLPITAKARVVQGVTFTIRDSSVANYYLRGTVEAQRTSTSSNSAWITLVSNLVLPRGSYILSGCPSGGSIDSYFLTFDTDIQTTTLYDSGNGLAFTVTDGEKIRVGIRYASEFDGDVTFYPMIRPASVVDDTYVPYAMTNRELTESREWKVLLDAATPTSVSVADLTKYTEIMVSGVKGGTRNVISQVLSRSSFTTRHTTFSFYDGTDLSLIDISISGTTISVNTMSNLSEVIISGR